MTTQSYGMNELPAEEHPYGFRCRVPGAIVEYSPGNEVFLVVPSNLIESGKLSGEVNAQTVSIITETGTEEIVLYCIRITTDYLEINGQQYPAHGSSIVG